MSQEARAARVWVWISIGLYVVLPAAVIVALVVFLFTKPEEDRRVEDDGKGRAAQPGDNPLAAARNALNKQPDLTTCRNVVQQLNGFLQQDQETSVPALSKADADRLRDELRLAADDLDELTRTSYTALDAYHLEACFLLRDAARSLEPPPPMRDGKPVRQTPLERAQAGFDWTVRQVRLQPPVLAEQAEAAPPVAVLRRGHGSSLERALAFLALIEQFGLDEENAGLQGCLLFCPDGKGEKRFWACGVAAGPRPEALYLFDPRLGLAVPGPDGKGVATLQQAQADPKVLGQLKIGKLGYDVTPEQAKQAEVRLVCPLSAAAPRMHFLQDRLLRDPTYKGQPLPAPVRVRLAESPDRMAALIRAAAASPGGKPPAVSHAEGGATLLRRFLPKDEGGSDPGDISVPLASLRGFTYDRDPASARFDRRRLFLLEAVPWVHFPERFRDPRIFAWSNPLGQKIRTVFSIPFISLMLDSSSPREMLLRGKHLQAVKDLVPEQERWEQIRQRPRDARSLEKDLKAWEEKAFELNVALAGARGTPEETQAAREEAKLWQFSPGGAMDVYFNGHIADGLSPILTYQLALAKHEQGAHYQIRVTLAQRAGLPPGSDLTNAQRAWTDAEGYWKEFLGNQAGRPGTAAARRLLGEAQARLDQAEQARKTWEDVSAPMTDLEKLASLWRARQAGK